MGEEMAAACSSPPIKIKILAAQRRPFPTVVRASKAEGPLRRPVAPAPPSLTATPPSPPVKPVAAPSQSPPKPVEKAAAAGVAKVGVVTLEYQRQMAKEMQEYFRQKKLEEADQGPFFGFLGKNEIANGRSALFVPYNLCEPSYFLVSATDAASCSL